MITQLLLNWLSGMVAALIDPIPTLPAEMAEVVANGEDAVAQFVGTAATLGPIVPYGAFTAMAAGFAGVMGYWGIVLTVRLVAWALGR